MFNPLNLFLACTNCNGQTRKGRSTILVGSLKNNFRKNAFEIVYPHDNPEVHYHFLDPDSRVYIDENKSTDIGVKSIKMFDLNNIEMIMARANWHKCKDDRIDPKFKSLIDKSKGKKRNRK